MYTIVFYLLQSKTVGVVARKPFATKERIVFTALKIILPYKEKNIQLVRRENISIICFN